MPLRVRRWASTSPRGSITLATELAAQEGLTNASFLQADAQHHAFDAHRFDVAISRTGTMFFGDPVAAFANIRRALRPDGRLMIMVWHAYAENAWISTFLPILAGHPVASPPPFSFGDPDHLRSVLTTAGYHDVRLDGHRAPMWFGTDIDDAAAWVLTQFGARLEGRDEDERAAAIAALRADLALHEGPDGVSYPSAVWFAGARALR